MLKGKTLLHQVTARKLSEKKVKVKEAKGVGRIVGCGLVSANKFHNA
jgi:hypothetical protein